jgi:hypothetical protein
MSQESSPLLESGGSAFLRNVGELVADVTSPLESPTGYGRKHNSYTVWASG